MSRTARADFDTRPNLRSLSQGEHHHRHERENDAQQRPGDEAELARLLAAVRGFGRHQAQANAPARCTASAMRPTMVPKNASVTNAKKMVTMSLSLSWIG